MKSSESSTQYQPSFHVVQDTFSQLREMIALQMRGAALSMIQNLFQQEVDNLCGAVFSHKNGEQCHRGGSDPGSVIVNGQRVKVRKPRVKSNGSEVELQSYRALKDYDLLCEKVMSHMLGGVSTRNYEALLDEMTNGLGLKKTTVSKAFRKGSLESLEKINGRDLSGHDFCAVMMDGVGFGERTVVVALGITTVGKKLILGLREGNTESGAVCGDLLKSLIERGVSNEKEILFVIDGGKALRSSIKKVFGSHHPVQRCIVHKLRNIKEYLPKEYHIELNRRWKLLHGCADYSVAMREYSSLSSWLARINHQAVGSLKEAEMETLTVVKLKVPGVLRKTLYSTNPIESSFSRTKDLRRNVKNWKSGTDQVSRWAAACLLEVEKKFRTVKGFKQIPVIMNEMRKKKVDSNQQVA
jgi:putative transposase